MRLPRRFTIQSLLIGVALVGLNLAAAIGTATPRGDWPRLDLKESPIRGSFHESDPRAEYGVACVYNGPFLKSTPETEAKAKLLGLMSETGRGADFGVGLTMARLTEVVRAPLPATRLQVWCPVLASVSITLLVLTLSSWRRSGLPGGVVPDAGGGWRAGRSTLRTAARWAWLIGSLIALNLAGVVHRPGFGLYEHDAAHPPSPAHGERLRVHPPSLVAHYSPHHQYRLGFFGDFSADQKPTWMPPAGDGSYCSRMEYRDLFISTPMVLNIEVGGVLVERCPMEVEVRYPEHSSGTRLPDVIFEDSPDGEATIDFRSDGGIVGHAGRPGTVLSPLRLIRTPTYSFLEVHWAAIASAAVTALVFVVIFRRLSPHQIQTLVIVLALAGLNAAAAFASFKIGEPPRLLSRTEILHTSTEPGEEYYSDGSRLFYVGGRRGLPRRVTRIERPHPPPTSLQIWWPVIASGSITLAVLGVLWRRARGRPADPTPVSRGGEAGRVPQESR